MNLMILVFAIPLLTVLLISLLKDINKILFLNLISSVLVFSSLLYSWVSGTSSISLFYIDKLSTFTSSVFAFTFTIISCYSIFYFQNQCQIHCKPVEVKNFFVFYNIFLPLVLLITLLDNIGLVWITVELTTLVSALMLGLFSQSKTLEAAWKYVILCSVGLLIALLGIVIWVLSLNSNNFDILSIQELLHHPIHLDDRILLQIAFALIFLGFATKVGLSPMHTWLPDAHGSAEAPLSCLLSAILLPAAMIPILRVKIVTDGLLESPNYTSSLMMFFAILTLIITTILIFNQSDIKRLLAYSSMENMALIMMGFAIGTPLTVWASLFQIFSHALIKTTLFASAGRIMLEYGTTKIKALKGIAKANPVLIIYITLALFVLVGMPLASIFIAKFVLLSVLAKLNPIYCSFIFLLIVLINIHIVFYFTKIFFGENDIRINHLNHKFYFYLPITICLLVVFSLGTFCMEPCVNYLSQVAEVLKFL